MEFNLIPKEVFDLVKDIYGDLAKPSVQTAGNAINSMFKFVMLPFRCLGMTVDEIEEKYKEFITKTLKKVKPDKLQPPPPNIAGPIFEHIKYRFNETDMMEFFSTLLARSMDIETCKFVHPALVEILKQISKTEAYMIDFFFSSKSILNNYGVPNFREFFYDFYRNINNKDYISISNYMRYNPYFFLVMK